jgi:hypothetical protein
MDQQAIESCLSGLPSSCGGEAHPKAVCVVWAGRARCVRTRRGGPWAMTRRRFGLAVAGLVEAPPLYTAFTQGLPCVCVDPCACAEAVELVKDA